MEMTLSRLRWAFAAFAVSAAFCNVREFAQTPTPRLIPRTKEERNAQYNSARRITLAVAVTDASGASLTGLQQNDFTLKENGRVRSLSRFEEVTPASQAHAHAIILLDAINGGRSSLNRQKKELKEFLSHSKTLPVPVALAVASFYGEELGVPSSDPTVLLNDMMARTKNLQPHDCDSDVPGSDLDSRMSQSVPVTKTSTSGVSETCFIDAFNASMRVLDQLLKEQANLPGVSDVIWLGSGWPLPREHDSGVVTGNIGLGDASNTVIALSADMVNAEVMFDGISWRDFEAPKGAHLADVPLNLKMASVTGQETLLTIPALAEETGGIALSRKKAISEVLGFLLQRDDALYVLAFDPADTQVPDQYRTVTVEVDKPGAVVHGMHWYFAQP